MNARQRRRRERLLKADTPAGLDHGMWHEALQRADDDEALSELESLAKKLGGYVPDPEPIRRAMRPRRKDAHAKVVTRARPGMPTTVREALVAGAHVEHKGGRRYSISFDRERVERTLDSLVAAAVASAKAPASKPKGKPSKAKPDSDHFRDLAAVERAVDQLQSEQDASRRRTVGEYEVDEVTRWGPYIYERGTGKVRPDLRLNDAGDKVVPKRLTASASASRTPLADALGQIGQTLDEEQASRDAERSDLASAIRLLAEKPAPTINVTLPQQPAPVVNVAAPVVNVEPPNIVVKTVPVGAQMVAAPEPPRKPRRVVVDYDPQGRKVFRELGDDE